MDDSAAPPSLQSDHSNTDMNRDAHSLEEPSSSVALRQWLILEKIFSYCGAENDTKSLLGARLVSKIWKSEATTALKQHDHLLPTLKVNGARLDSILDFVLNLDPWTDLPLKVILMKWTSPQVDLLRTYVRSIVSIELDFTGCPELQFADAIDLTLPQLRYVKLRGCNCRNHTHRLDSPEVMNGLKLLERLTQAGNVETCEVFMPLRYEADDAALLPLPNQITGLHGVDSRLLDTLTAVREYPRLDKVTIKSPNRHQLSSEFLNLKPDQLKELSIDNNLELYKPLGKLKSLTITRFASVSGSEPLPALLPRLSKVGLVSFYHDGVTRNGEVHQNVSDLKLTLDQYIRPSDRPRMELFGANLKTAFPRLTNLQLELHLIFLNGNDVSFCPLYSEGLKYLELYGDVNHEDGAHEGVDMVKLISGVSWDDIPRSEWSSALVGRQDAITNLSRLQKLTISLMNKHGYRPDVFRLSNDESQFLFRAVFENMASLQELQFKYCVIENETVKQEWRRSGKLLVEKELTIDNHE